MLQANISTLAWQQLEVETDRAADGATGDFNSNINNISRLLCLILQTNIHKLSKYFFPSAVLTFIDPAYLGLLGNPLVVSMLAPPTLSAPQLLMASQTRDKLDEGSHSPRSEPLYRAGSGADGAAFWTGSLFCRESKCVAQSSWSSVCKDTLKNKVMKSWFWFLCLYCTWFWFLLFPLYLALQQFFPSPTLSRLLSLLVQLLQPASFLLLSPLDTQHLLHWSDLLQSQQSSGFSFYNVFEK